MAMVCNRPQQILVYMFGEKDYVFLKLKKLLKHFNVEINYIDNLGSYRKYIDRNEHEIEKANTQKIEKKT